MYDPGAGSTVPPSEARITTMACSPVGGLGGKKGFGTGSDVSGGIGSCAFAAASRSVEASNTKRQIVEYFASFDNYLISPFLLETFSFMVSVDLLSAVIFKLFDKQCLLRLQREKQVFFIVSYLKQSKDSGFSS